MKNKIPSLVLVVDDDESIRDALTYVLEGEGYQVNTAKNGLEGLRSLKENKPTLVLLDSSMPIMDGAEFKEQMDSFEEYDQIPVFAISAGLTKKIPKPTGWLAKPFDLDQLLNTIKPYLEA